MSKVQVVLDQLQVAKSKAQGKIQAATDSVKSKVEHLAVDALDKGIALSEKQLQALKTVRDRQS